MIPTSRAFGALFALATSLAAGPLHALPVTAPITGEILQINLNTPGDYWSAGTMVVGGKSITLPRNLLIDLPANRLTLWQLFDQAPAACKALGQTGLAKGDSCNTTGQGGIAAISANRTNGGNIIAGDLLVKKGAELSTGVVTYIDYAQGYLRLDGNLNDPNTGLMARMNDPTSRHSVQNGLGCATGTANCSPDARFALDADNYTNTFTTGYPMCIPSTVARTFAGLAAQGTGATLSAAVAGGTVAALANGTGDRLCPTTNRPDRATPVGVAVNDSRFFAPVMLGDSVTLEGNFERVNGVKFLSFHTSKVLVALGTNSKLSQPDYLRPDEVFIDAPGFQNQRARSLVVG